MNRRQFIKSTTGGMGAVVLPASGTSAVTAKQTEPLGTEGLVIGAGVAGLTCARELVARNHQVTVLEARPDRYGGRLWTSDVWRAYPDARASTLNIPVDMGASWIHGVVNNPITTLAARIKASLVESRYDRSVLYGPDGRLTNENALGLTDLASATRHAISAGQSADRDQSLYQTIWSGTHADAKTSHEQALIRFLMSARYETEYGGSVSGIGLGSHRRIRVGEMSTFWFDDQGKDRLRVTGEDMMFLKGYTQIADHLASGLNIKLGKTVTRIDYSDTRVNVLTSDGSSYRADRVVVTVPLGVLKKGAIDFAPALPSMQAHAIRRIGMGVLNKLYLKFDSPFWVDGNDVKTTTDWIESVPPAGDTLQTWTEWVNFTGSLQQNVLLAFSAADAAVELESLSDEQIIHSAMTRLRRLYGKKAMAPTHFMRTRWSKDPYTYGSYSFNAAGTTPKSRSELATPINGKLFFAGEATDTDYFGTVHGAYQSGIDVARKVIKSWP